MNLDENRLTGLEGEEIRRKLADGKSVARQIGYTESCFGVQIQVLRADDLAKSSDTV